MQQKSREKRALRLRFYVSPREFHALMRRRPSVPRTLLSIFSVSVLTLQSLFISQIHKNTYWFKFVLLSSQNFPIKVYPENKLSCELKVRQDGDEFSARLLLLECELKPGPAASLFFFTLSEVSCRFVHVKCERMTRWAERERERCGEQALLVKCQRRRRMCENVPFSQWLVDI